MKYAHKDEELIEIFFFKCKITVIAVFIIKKTMKKFIFQNISSK